MKTNELKTIDLEEMSFMEAKNTSGGFWDWVFGVIIGGIIYDLISNPKHNSEVIAEGENDALSMY